MISFLSCVHSKGSVVCKMTLNFAAEPLSKNDDLLKDLQENVSSGKVGDLSVDADYILNVEPDVGKIFLFLCMKGNLCEEIVTAFVLHCFTTTKPGRCRLHCSLSLLRTLFFSSGSLRSYKRLGQENIIQWSFLEWKHSPKPSCLPCLAHEHLFHSGHLRTVSDVKLYTCINIF